MSKEIRIELSEEDFEELKRIKDRLDTTWRNMLKRGNTVDITPIVDESGKIKGYARRKGLELKEVDKNEK